MVEVAQLPAINAGLNAAALALLIAGRAALRGARRFQPAAVELHARLMGAAFGVSALFLALYVAHKFLRDFQHTSYGGEGAAQVFYLALLATHIVLAALVPVLAVLLIKRGRAALQGDAAARAAHRRLARWAWPVWIYVSLSGIAIYLLLYPFNPAAVAE